MVSSSGASPGRGRRGRAAAARLGPPRRGRDTGLRRCPARGWGGGRGGGVGGGRALAAGRGRVAAGSLLARNGEEARDGGGGTGERAIPRWPSHGATPPGKGAMAALICRPPLAPRRRRPRSLRRRTRLRPRRCCPLCCSCCRAATARSSPPPRPPTTGTPAGAGRAAPRTRRCRLPSLSSPLSRLGTRRGRRLGCTRGW